MCYFMIISCEIASNKNTLTHISVFAILGVFVLIKLHGIKVLVERSPAATYDIVLLITFQVV